MDAFVDTSIIIDIYRGYGHAVAWVQAKSALRLSITPVVWMEALTGANNKSDQGKMLRLLAAFTFTYLTQVDQDWAMKQLQLYRLSHTFGMNDCLIAAPSHRLQLPLFTRNLKHFTPLVGGLAQQPY